MGHVITTFPRLQQDAMDFHCRLLDVVRDVVDPARRASFDVQFGFGIVETLSCGCCERLCGSLSVEPGPAAGRRSVQEQLVQALPPTRKDVCSLCKAATKVSSCFASDLVVVPIRRLGKGGLGSKLVGPLPLDVTVRLPGQATAAEFDLVAAAVHHGATNEAGHYTSCVKLRTGSPRWALVDDAAVKLQPQGVVQHEKLAQKDVLRGAVLAFYCRRVSDSAPIPAAESLAVRLQPAAVVQWLRSGDVSTESVAMLQEEGGGLPGAASASAAVSAFGRGALRFTTELAALGEYVTEDQSALVTVLNAFRQSAARGDVANVVHLSDGIVSGIASSLRAARAVLQVFSEPLSIEHGAAPAVTSSPFLQGTGPFGAAPASVCSVVDLREDGPTGHDLPQAASPHDDLPPPPYFVVERLRGLGADVHAVIAAFPTFECTVRAMCVQPMEWISAQLEQVKHVLADTEDAQTMRILRTFVAVGESALLPRVPSWLHVCLGALSFCSSGPAARQCREACTLIIVAAAKVRVEYAVFCSL